VSRGRLDAVIRRSITVPAAVHHYDVLIEPGLIDRLADALARYAPAARYAVIADAAVAALYGDRTVVAARASGSAADLFTFPPGERSKTRATWGALTDAMLEAGIGRDACVIALGGGVTTDLAGFVAATYMRGLPCVQVPTSLLAMIDASIGGKTGVDAPAGKNLVGAFAPPRCVVVDPGVLGTLPAVERRAGLAEAVKHAAIGDAGHFEALEGLDADAWLLDPETPTDLVARSIGIKAAIVEADPNERGRRAILNFGHTIAHAIERVTAYEVGHGHAVAIGMVVEARLGEALGITRPGTAARLAALLERLGLPTAPPAVPVRAIVAATATDKKARGGAVRYALLSAIGAAAGSDDAGWTVSVPPESAAAILSAMRTPGVM
jgi:3-dehydroquinate synthase